VAPLVARIHSRGPYTPLPDKEGFPVTEQTSWSPHSDVSSSILRRRLGRDWPPKPVVQRSIRW